MNVDASRCWAVALALLHGLWPSADSSPPTSSTTEPEAARQAIASTTLDDRSRRRTDPIDPPTTKSRPTSTEWRTKMRPTTRRPGGRAGR